MNYQEKYLKYKIKYLNLKNQKGRGKLEGCLPMIASSIPGKIYEGFYNKMTSSTDNYELTEPKILPEEDPIYDRFMETLEKINNSDKPNKMLVLKLGSSSIVDGESKHRLLPINSLDPTYTLLNKINENKLDDSSNIFIICIDPLHPEYTILNPTIERLKIPEENLIRLKGFFPIAPGNEKGNLIINKLINLNVDKLIIINEMGSGCYNSIRAIRNLRKNTLYYAYVNNPEQAFDCGLEIYSHKGTYNRCKRENPDIYKNNWINLKTLTDEGDETEPETYDEKLAKEAESEKIIVTVRDASANKFKLNVSKNITVDEFSKLFFEKYGFKLDEFSIYGSSYSLYNDKKKKLIDLNKLFISNPVINLFQRF